MRKQAIQALLLAACLWACGDQRQAPSELDMKSNASLAAHSKEFEQGVVKVTEGVYVAIGYGIANSILLEGEDGVVIVDTMESAEAARPVKAAFAEITSKPVKGIIYTHNHADHVFGAGIMAGEDQPDVYSHVSTLYYLDRVVNVIRPIIYKRAMRQFGTMLPEGEVVNAGIGPCLLVNAKTTPALVRPNKTFDGDQITIEVAGITMELVHAPGETPDQIFVWIPSKKVLLPGDNYYKSFPNLYAIRGTAYRDVMQWVSSLDKMRALRPEYLVPSHTRPLAGADGIFDTLTDYRDAIQFVHDQTVRGMNEGLRPEEIVERVRLPGHLTGKPYLQEFYGRVDWSVRAIFTGYLGWFGGNATDLVPLAPADRARRLSALAGGRDKLMAEARSAAGEGDAQWAVELADHALALDPSDREAGRIRADALRALGEAQVSANGRNYYLTQALEAEGKMEIAPPDPSKIPIDQLQAFPIENFMRSLPVNLNAAKSADKNIVVAFRFTDLPEDYTVHVRKGVAEVQRGLPESPDMTVQTKSMIWKEVLTGHRNAAVAIATGAVSVDGGRLDLVKFLLLFRP